MSFPYQTLLDADGRPVAVQIAWEDFKQIQQRLDQQSDPAVSPEWRKEIQSRVAEIDSGQVTLVDGDAFLERLRAM